MLISYAFSQVSWEANCGWLKPPCQRVGLNLKWFLLLKNWLSKEPLAYIIMWLLRLTLGKVRYNQKKNGLLRLKFQIPINSRLLRLLKNHIRMMFHKSSAHSVKQAVNMGNGSIPNNSREWMKVICLTSWRMVWVVQNKLASVLFSTRWSRLNLRLWFQPKWTNRRACMRIQGPNHDFLGESV